MLSITFPSTWQTFSDGGQLVAHGPNGEEVILSRSKISGDGSAAERESAISKLHSGVLQTMHRAASDPDLSSAMLHDDITLPNQVLVRRMSSTSPRLAVQFEQFALCYDDEILYLTYEAPLAACCSFRLIEQAIENVHIDQPA